MSYRVHKKGKADVINEFRNQLDFFKGYDVDFIVCEVGISVFDEVFSDINTNLFSVLV